MPKDSLAIDPKPFFASTPALGMFGKLDELDANDKASSAKAPQAKSSLPDLIDLPAPNDLPAVKRPSPKATALGPGRGGTMPKDSLDLPPKFGGAAQPCRRSCSPPEPAGLLGLEDSSTRDAPTLPALSELDLPAPRDLPAVKKRPAPNATALGLGNPVSNAAKSGFEVQLRNAQGTSSGGASAGNAASLRSHAEEPRAQRHAARSSRSTCRR